MTERYPMQYAILCYHDKKITCAWSKEEDDAVMAKLGVVMAIAAIHARAKTFRETDWSEIDRLYGTLERMQPSPVVSLNRAVAVSKARGPAAAPAMIEPLASKLGSYFYFHGARGAFLQELGCKDEARVAFDRAIALANTPAEAAHIRMQIDRLMQNGAAAITTDETATIP
jgi:RNA polymerase sigma-70 factor, ECF subfamily